MIKTKEILKEQDGIFIHVDKVSKDSISGWIGGQNILDLNNLKITVDRSEERYPELIYRPDVVEKGYSKISLCGFSMENLFLGNSSILEFFLTDKIIGAFMVADDDVNNSDLNPINSNELINLLNKFLDEKKQSGKGEEELLWNIFKIKESQQSNSDNTNLWLAALLVARNNLNDPFGVKTLLNIIEKDQNYESIQKFIPKIASCSINSSALDSRTSVTKKDVTISEFQNYKTAFDFTDFINYLKTGSNFSGIQRLQLVILLENIKNKKNPEDFLIFYYDNESATFYRINNKNLFLIVKHKENLIKSDFVSLAWMLRYIVLGETLLINKIYVENLILVGLPTNHIFEHYLEDFIRITRAKFYPIVHDLIPIENPYFVSVGFYSNFYNYLNVVRKNSHRILTVSNYIKNKLCSYFNLSENYIDLVFNGSDFFEYWEINSNSILNSLKLSQNNHKKNKFTNVSILVPENFFMCIGGNDFRKNYLSLVWVWDLLTSQWGVDTPYIVVVGADSNATSYFNSLSKLEAKISEKIIFLTNISDENLKILYQKCRGVLIPSLSEGCGLPALEAKFFEKPLIYNTGTSLNEASDGYGSEVNFAEPSSVVQAINRILQNSEISGLLKRVTYTKWKDFYKQLIKQIDANLEGRHLIDKNTLLVKPGNLYAGNLEKFSFDGSRKNLNFKQIPQCCFDYTWNLDRQNPITWSRHPASKLYLGNVASISKVKICLSLSKESLQTMSEMGIKPLLTIEQGSIEKKQPIYCIEKMDILGDQLDFEFNFFIPKEQKNDWYLKFFLEGSQVCDGSEIIGFRFIECY